MYDNHSIFAVVLAWNHINETKACLESLIKTNYSNFHIILVDNGSTDKTFEIISEKFPLIKILRLEKNVGIAQGYNHGIQYAINKGADYVMVMNNDTIIPVNMVTNLHQAIQKKSKVGIVMPKIYHFFGEANRIWCAGARWRHFPPGIKQIGANKIDNPDFNLSFTIEYAPSCCLLIKKEVFVDVGLFDPNYYFYFDDWDFSERTRKGGYEIIFEPSAHMWHKVAISTRKAKKPANWWFAFGQSSVRFFLMHKSQLNLFFHSLWFVIREIVKLNLFKVFPFITGIACGIATQRKWNNIIPIPIPKLLNDGNFNG